MDRSQVEGGCVLERRVRNGYSGVRWDAMRERMEFKVFALSKNVIDEMVPRKDEVQSGVCYGGGGTDKENRISKWEKAVKSLYFGEVSTNGVTMVTRIRRNQVLRSMVRNVEAE